MRIVDLKSLYQYYEETEKPDGSFSLDDINYYFQFAIKQIITSLDSVWTPKD